MTKPFVVDSSVTVKWLNQIDEILLEEADKLLLDTQAGKVNLLTPELSKYEIGNALLKKGLDLQMANEALETFYQLPISFIPETEELAKNTYKIAHKNKITYYDAAFIALALEQKAALITENIKHQGKSKSTKVISLKDY